MFVIGLIVIGLLLLAVSAFAFAHIARTYGSKTAALIAIIVGGIIYGAHFLAFPSWTVRHRWTYEIEVDGKLHTGSGVMETTVSTGFTCGGVNGGHHCHGFRGEAVPIDLGKHGKIFALLVSPGGGDNFVELGPEQIALRLGLQKAWSKPGADPRDTTWAGLVRHGLKTELLPEEIPMLVRFKDIKDPKTIERVTPNDMSAVLGPSVRLRAVRIDTTRDEVSQVIVQHIPWLPLPRDRTVAELFYTSEELEHYSTLPPERKLAEYAFMRRK